MESQMHNIDDIEALLLLLDLRGVIVGVGLQ